MNTARIYHLRGECYAALKAGEHRERAANWMFRARQVPHPDDKRLCVRAARTEHALYVQWLRGQPLPRSVTC